MVDYNTLSLVLTGIGLIVAITSYTVTLRNTSKARQRELIFQRLQTFDREFSKAWTNVMFKDVKSQEEWIEAFNPFKNPHNFADTIFLQSRYNSLGMMLKEKVVNLELLFQIYQPNSIMRAWETFEPSITYRREKENNPSLMSAFEYLYEEVKKRYPNIGRSIFFEGK